MEHRQATRFETRLAARIAGNGRLVSGTVNNVSQEGMHVRLPPGVQPPARIVNVHLDLKQRNTRLWLQLQGLVIHTRSGFGVMFSKFNENHASLIGYLRELSNSQVPARK